MSQITQREAVYNAVCAIFGTTEFDGAVSLTDAQRKQVQAMVCEGFTSGSVEFKDTPSNQEKLANPSLLNAYVSGLVNNWMRKDKRLNGGEKYQSKNPGSRAGSQDPQLRELKKLLSVTENADHRAKIESAMSKRIMQVAIEKAAAKISEIDTAKLPEDIAALIAK